MSKITFLGAGSSVFAKNILGDCLRTESLMESEINLYDIDAGRLKESEIMINALNDNFNGGKAKIKGFLGTENRKEALRGANYVVNAIQVGGYDPCTITDFEIPKKFGLRQTIADTLGIGGIMRGLRTIPVMKDFAEDIEKVCPDAWLLNYTNPMGILTGYMLRHTGVKTIGLCHSVQKCSEELFGALGMEAELEGRREHIAGINHMAWLLEIRDRHGKDLYPEIRRRALEKNKESNPDRVRLEYVNRFGHYCTESSEHNAEYSPFFIKSNYPELIETYQIPLDEYPRRCIRQMEEWDTMKNKWVLDPHLTHERTNEYASYILHALQSGKPYSFGGNVINTGGLIENLPHEACVEVPCLADGSGIRPVHVGRLPEQLAAMNRSNLNVQLLTIEAAATLKKEHIYHAAMMDPHTAAELSIDHITQMVDELLEAHGDWMPDYK